jgi:outer membrane lipoprotein SlyB
MKTMPLPIYLTIILSTVLTLNGCATRALMSSDRYEKPDSKQHYHDLMGQNQPFNEQKIRQAYLSRSGQTDNPVH